MTTVTVEIEELPNADAGNPFELTCEENTVSLGGPGTSTGSEFTYMWTSSTGQVGNATALNPTVGKPGIYTLQVRNENTGCISFDDVEITASAEIPTDVEVDLQAPECFGDPDASITVLNVVGGVGPYSYSLDSVNFVSNPVFGNLDAGDYTLYVVDANGCPTQSSFSIDEVFEQDGTIEGELLINEGDATTLTYIYSPDVPDSTIWIVNGEVFCTNCDSIVIEPVEQTEVMLIMFDENNCEIVATALVVVKKNRDVFIPNVFSPNNDGFNDYFTIYPGADGVEVQNFTIYSRWGEIVFNNPGPFDPLDESQGWDGSFAGKDVLPGVYVYKAELVYPGESIVEIVKGDITLVR